MFQVSTVLLFDRDVGCSVLKRCGSTASNLQIQLDLYVNPEFNLLQFSGIYTVTDAKHI